MENFTIYEYNMDYLMKVWYSKNEKEIAKYKYILMMDLKKEELEKLSKKGRVIDKYMEEVVRVNEDPDFREYISAEEDARKIENSLRDEYRREGLAEGREAGLAEGRAEEKRETAKKMKEKEIDTSIISEVTGLTIEEINEL